MFVKVKMQSRGAIHVMTQQLAKGEVQGQPFKTLGSPDGKQLMAMSQQLAAQFG